VFKVVPVCGPDEYARYLTPRLETIPPDERDAWRELLQPWLRPEDC
jgi:hypothetical protein